MRTSEVLLSGAEVLDQAGFGYAPYYISNAPIGTGLERAKARDLFDEYFIEYEDDWHGNAHDADLGVLILIFLATIAESQGD